MPKNKKLNLKNKSEKISRQRMKNDDRGPSLQSITNCGCQEILEIDEKKNITEEQSSVVNKYIREAQSCRSNCSGNINQIQVIGKNEAQVKQSKKNLGDYMNIFLFGMLVSEFEDNADRVIDLLIPPNSKKLKVAATDVIVSSSILGKGKYGVVKKGILLKSGSHIKVAVKEANTGKVKTLVHETEIMSDLDHENLVKILGIQTTPAIRIIMEFMDLGDITGCILHKRLRFSVKQLLQGSFDVASGMEYLAVKNIVYIDLSLKNILVNSSLQFKIGDFGIANYVDERTGEYAWDVKLQGIVNIFNIPPEARPIDGIQVFSWKTDVWAMGLLIWDLFQLSALQGSNAKIEKRFEYFQKIPGYQLPHPKKCPKNLHLFAMGYMMHPDQNQRPTFTQIKNNILQYL